MRLLFIILLLLVFSATVVHGEDNLFNSTTAIKNEFIRLGEEASLLGKTTLDTKESGLTATLAVLGATGLTYVFDGEIRSKFHAAKGHTLDNITDAGSFLGEPLLQLGIAATVYTGGLLAGNPSYRETGEMLGEALVLADATTLLFKEATGRARPVVSSDKRDFRPFGFAKDYDSLPSMHTSSSFAMASVLASAVDGLPAKLGWYSAAAFVGFSRVYQDKHWASDVVLGAAIGELCGRVVTRYHAVNKRGSIAVTPMVTSNVASLNLLGRW